MQRMQVWASMFCMGNPNHKEPQDIFPLYFDDWSDDDDDDLPITEEDKQELIDLMRQMNEQTNTVSDGSPV